MPWTKPDELAIAPGKPFPELGAVVLFADGSVRPIGTGLDDKTWAALVTRRGGEKVELKAPVLGPPAVAQLLNDVSWGIVRRADAASDQYRWGLRLAEKACRLRPENGLILNTLGVAQYRVGRYQDAVANLERSDRLNAEQLKGSIPADLAFLAMSRHRLGQAEPARTDLHRLRECMKKPDQAKNEESLAFLREAEAHIEGKRDSKK